MDNIRLAELGDRRTLSASYELASLLITGEWPAPSACAACAASSPLSPSPVSGLPLSLYRRPSGGPVGGKAPSWAYLPRDSADPDTAGSLTPGRRLAGVRAAGASICSGAWIRRRLAELLTTSWVRTPEPAPLGYPSGSDQHHLHTPCAQARARTSALTRRRMGCSFSWAPPPPLT
eukprot:scaffold14357_cov101-Isochrysis_galbana.AAC.4